MIENAQYGDAEQTTINATIDGSAYSIPTNPGNRHYAMIVDWLAEDPGHEIAPYVPPPVDNTPTLRERLAALEQRMNALERIPPNA